MDKDTIDAAITRLTERGLQSRISMRTKIKRPTLCNIFKGLRRATAKQAALLEQEFTVRCIPINRWDLLYGVEDGQSLREYLEKKENS